MTYELSLFFSNNLGVYKLTDFARATTKKVIMLLAKVLKE